MTYEELEMELRHQREINQLQAELIKAQKLNLELQIETTEQQVELETSAREVLDGRVWKEAFIQERMKGIGSMEDAERKSLMMDFRDMAQGDGQEYFSQYRHILSDELIVEFASAMWARMRNN